MLSSLSAKVQAALPRVVAGVASVAVTTGAAKLIDVTGRVGSVAWKDGAKFAGIYQATQFLTTQLFSKASNTYVKKYAPVISVLVSGVFAHVALNSRFINGNLSWKVSAVLTATAAAGAYLCDLGNKALENRARITTPNPENDKTAEES